MFRKRRRVGGYTVIELTLAVAIVATVMSVTTPPLQRALRRARLRSAVQEITSLVSATRAQALRRHNQVCLFVDLNRRRIVMWADRPPYNYVQDANESTILQYRIPAFVYFRSPAGGGVDGSEAVAFDTYAGDSRRRNLVVFRGDGSLVAPESPQSQPAARPSAYTDRVPSGSVNCGASCRGIFIADRESGGNSQRNVFRISVDDFGSSGRASLLKWLPDFAGGNAGENDFVPAPWRWVN